MKNIYWQVQLTMSSSTRQRACELATEDRRSAANYIRLLIEKDIIEKDTPNEQG